MKRHSLDVLSLVFGLIFLLVAASWITRHSLRVEMPDPGWYIAGALIVAGLFGIISTLRGSRSRKEAETEQVTAADYEPAESAGWPAQPDTQEFGKVTESKPEDRGLLGPPWGVPRGRRYSHIPAPAGCSRQSRTPGAPARMRACRAWRIC
jgi:hypothetical protein